MADEKEVKAESSPAASRDRRTLGGLFVNKQLLKRYVMLVVAITMISSCLIGFVIHQSIKQSLENETRRSSKVSVYEVLMDVNNTLLIRVFLILFVSVLVTGVAGILFLHRIAGPLYRIRGVLKSLADGKIPDKNPALAPNCATCHGIHGATPPGVSEVPNVCGNCHSVTANAFKEGPHYIALEEAGAPRCVDCHSNHKIIFPSLAMFDGSEEGHCGMCHSEDDARSYGKGQEIKKALATALKAIEQGEEGVKEAESAGRNIDDLSTNLEKAHNDIVQATTLIHTLNPKTVGDLTQSAIAKIEGISQVAEQVRNDLRIRKRALAFFIAWIFLAAGLLYFKHRSLTKE